MIPRIRNALFFMLVNLSLAQSQIISDSIPPGKYLIDSLEFEKLCKPEYRPSIISYRRKIPKVPIKF